MPVSEISVATQDVTVVTQGSSCKQMQKTPVMQNDALEGAQAWAEFNLNLDLGIYLVTLGLQENHYNSET